jgi:hypothetical protein
VLLQAAAPLQPPVEATELATELATIEELTEELLDELTRELTADDVVVTTEEATLEVVVEHAPKSFQVYACAQPVPGA